MKTIFENMKGEWDKFGGDKAEVAISMVVGKGWMVKVYWDDEPNDPEYYSLPDLLANKSWTEALGLSWKKVRTAFNHLRERGDEAAIDYIKKTMI